MSASIHFSIKFDGPALTSHQMDVRELAPALIALSSLLEEANRVAFPDSDEIRVQIKGNFKGGSFGVDLVALQNITAQIVSMLTGPSASAASNLSGILQGLGMLGGVGAGLIGLIKWLRGRKPSAIRLDGDKTIFEIQTSEEIESFEVDLVAGKLYQSRVVRQTLAKVVKPLEREGVDIFACGQDGATVAVVTKAEVQYFELAADSIDVVSVTESVLLQIESAVFKEGNKWRFTDGASSFFAEIADDEFLARVESGDERFGKGDVLVVDLRRIQSVTDNGLKLEYSVEKVRDHRAPLQARLLPN
jgi:hypothetical protein